MDVSSAATPSGTWWLSVARRTVVRVSQFVFKRIVTVGSRPYRITVSQRAKSVWIALGDFDGGRLEVKGRSDTDAVSAWRDAALYKDSGVSLTKA